MRRFVIRSSVGALLVAASFLAACGDDDSSDAGTTDVSTESTATTDEYEIVSDAVVAQGLASTSADMAALAAAPETATADAVLQVFDEWGSYEGTIKQNEPGTYIDLEDALSVFKKSAENGDAVGMQAAIADFGELATKYLTTYPG